ncbi:hypothetical protein P8C59_003595 [Phyllachora maydis]|uniref:Uncharacterized protein n=1 Tax=Phyllachora maydis TaxID=1825666 RepID=A0AAD9MBL0_9PEZI|nr:hypothetical protein P8C59_003595 [Phyllachora maydis]
MAHYDDDDDHEEATAFDPSLIDDTAANSRHPRRAWDLDNMDTTPIISSAHTHNGRLPPVDPYTDPLAALAADKAQFRAAYTNQRRRVHVHGQLARASCLPERVLTRLHLHRLFGVLAWLLVAAGECAAAQARAARAQTADVLACAVGALAVGLRGVVIVFAAAAGAARRGVPLRFAVRVLALWLLACALQSLGPAAAQWAQRVTPRERGQTNG